MEALQKRKKTPELSSYVLMYSLSDFQYDLIALLFSSMSFCSFALSALVMWSMWRHTGSLELAVQELAQAVMLT